MDVNKPIQKMEVDTELKKLGRDPKSPRGAS